jgi:hypothetical protein
MSRRGLGFQFVELFEQLFVGAQALGFRLNLAAHQASRINSSRRHHRIDRAVMHRRRPTTISPNRVICS